MSTVLTVLMGKILHFKNGSINFVRTSIRLHLNQLMISFTVSLRQNQNYFHGEFMINKFPFKMNCRENLDLCHAEFMVHNVLKSKSRFMTQYYTGLDKHIF